MTGPELDFSGRRLIVLAASAFVVLAAEPLFLLVDTAVIGHLGRVPLAALGAGATIMSVLSIIGSSLEYGTTSRAARQFGAGDRAAAVGEGVQASWLGLGAGLLAVLVGEALAGPFCRLVAGESGQVAGAATRWLQIALPGLPALLLVQAGNGWMRGVQDTRTPVRVVLIANVISAAASPVLVYPLGFGLTGSAVANLIAQWLAALFCCRALLGQASSMRIHWHLIRTLLLVGRDLVLRAAAFEVAFLVAAAVAGRLGSAQLAAHQIGLQLWNLMALLLDSFAIAAMAMVPAALGRGDRAVAALVARRVSGYGAVAGLFFAVLFAAGWSVIPALFTADAQVRHQCAVLWPWLVTMLPVGGVVFALDGVLLGAGDNAFVRSLTLVAALGGFVPLCLLTQLLGWGLGGVWAGLAGFIAIRFVGMTIRARGSKWLVTGNALP